MEEKEQILTSCDNGGPIWVHVKGGRIIRIRPIVYDDSFKTWGAIEGARKGHNPKDRGKKGLRPVLCFLAETRESLCGTQRRGEAVTMREVARQIRQFRKLLPAHVREVRVHGDGEFLGWESVRACREERFAFTFGNKRCAPAFPEVGWYRHGEHEYNAASTSPQAGRSPVGLWRCASSRTSGGTGS